MKLIISHRFPALQHRIPFKGVKKAGEGIENLKCQEYRTERICRTWFGRCRCIACDRSEMVLRGYDTDGPVWLCKSMED